MQTPSVGRIVHYVRIRDSFHVASIVADVPDSERGVCSLRLFYPNTECVTYEGFVLYDARMSPGTWHYPEHVGTVSVHESEEIPAPNTASYPDPERDRVLDGDGRDSVNIPPSLREFES